MVNFNNVPEVSIGVVGHVDHGKTSLVETLTGKWTSTYSEEMKRGITIRLGYADAQFYFCGKDGGYSATAKCPACMGDCSPARAVSFVDAPGHEMLMATVMSGSALMDGALLVIAANEKCPRPQTAEHLKALDIAGIGKIVIVQNKVDIVSEQQALENYNEIRNFVKGTVAENAPIVPVSALHNANIDVLIETIEKTIPTPERRVSDKPLFYVARSFDVNRPGTAIEKLSGGVLGGSLRQGEIKVGDEVEIAPGRKEGGYKPLKTRIAGIVQGGARQQKAGAGGLCALETQLDPSLTRGDLIAGRLAGFAGNLPECKGAIVFKPHLFDYVVGVAGEMKVEKIKTGEVLLVTAAVAKTVGTVKSATPAAVEMQLKIPVCAERGNKISVARQAGGRWHLIGYGEVG